MKVSRFQLSIKTKLDQRDKAQMIFKDKKESTYIRCFEIIAEQFLEIE